MVSICLGARAASIEGFSLPKENLPGETGE
jgi:hypothetical protein